MISHNSCYSYVSGRLWNRKVSILGNEMQCLKTEADPVRNDRNHWIVAKHDVTRDFAYATAYGAQASVLRLHGACPRGAMIGS
jgi:hypothetical protein